MKCRNTQSCQFRQKDYSQFRNKQLITDFHFTESCSKDIFDFLIDAWWYFWTNCPEVSSKLMKFHTPHQEFIIQNLHALLWCKLHRSTSSQLGTKLIFRKYLSCLVANLSTSIKPRLSTSTQIMSKGFSFFCFLHFNFVSSWHEVFHPNLGWSCIRPLALSLLVGELPTRLPDNLSRSGLSRITKIIRDNFSHVFIFRL